MEVKMPVKKVVNTAIDIWNSIVEAGNQYHRANYTKYTAAVKAGMKRDPAYEKKFKQGNTTHDNLKIDRWK